MYGKKAIYFNYKTYGGFIAFVLIPFLLVMFGLSLGAFTFLAWQPMFIGIGLGLLLAMPGYPRLSAINANINLKANKYTKALKKTTRAMIMPFTPVGVKIFHAYVLLINGELQKAKDLLKKIKNDRMVYSEKAKWEAVYTFTLWLDSGNTDQALQHIEKTDMADEAIAYAKGKLLNALEDKAAARNYNDKAYGKYNANRDILSNLIIAYTRTTQDRDAKILFRTLYQDLNATSDSLYYMAQVKLRDGKKTDAAEFMQAAFDIEESALDIVSHDEIKGHLERLNNELNREEL